MSRILRSISLLLGAAATVSPAVPAEPVLVDDGAGLLTAGQRDSIEQYHAALLKDFDIDYRLITVRGGGDIVAFGAARFEALKIGKLSTSGRGLLLVIDPVTDRVRLEVGHNLEGIYTDGFIAYVQQRQMVPFFRADRVADGILATTELIVGQARKAASRSGFDVPTGVSGSGGGGATSQAGIGQPAAQAGEPDGPVRAAGLSPDETLHAYAEAMQARDGRTDLEIYSVATQHMLRNGVRSPAQMDNVARAYRSCAPGTTRIAPDGRRAVIRYPVSRRACPPYFFVREQGKWKLDFPSLRDAIRFNHRNFWHFADGAPVAYAFGFEDWKFDRHGFPMVRRDVR